MHVRSVQLQRSLPVRTSRVGLELKPHLQQFTTLKLGLVLCLHGCSPNPPPKAALADAATRPTALPDSGTSKRGADLGVDMGRTQVDLSIVTETFHEEACELAQSEQCVTQPGPRKLLRFTVETPNYGEQDLVIGAPSEHPGFQWSECHEHSHFRGFAEYRLLSSDGMEVLMGHKQAFCLLDSQQYRPGSTTQAIYSCTNQGIQAGWSDVYRSSLPCQFLDITDVPDGDYQLQIEVNPQGLLEDADPGNNIGTIPVSLGASVLTTPTETCPELPSRYLNTLSQECGWQQLGEFDCTPGMQTGVGCAQNCGMGSCSGDPMLRACDAAQLNCSSSAALGENNDHCGSLCPMIGDFLCPSSGRLVVYAASAKSGASYTCQVAIGPTPPYP